MLLLHADSLHWNKRRRYTKRINYKMIDESMSNKAEQKKKNF